MDISTTVQSNSDQLTAEDLKSGPRILTVSRVVPGPDEKRKVAIYYQEDSKHPFLPCLSMRRILLELWGRDSKEYVGRGIEVFCDMSVSFNGIKGGVRIKSLSHINGRKNVTVMGSGRRPVTYAIEELKPWPPVAASQAPQQSPAREAARPARTAVTQAQQQPVTDLATQAHAKCLAEGLTEAGIARLCEKLSDNTADDLGGLQLKTLEAIIKNGISAKTVAECNG